MKQSLLRQSLFRLWIAAIIVLFALHVVHLRADFPNFSPWMDYSKYTDEGWYGKAAIEHYVLGHWRVEGDFNPSVALPVFPFLELVLFRFTGVNVVAARCLILAVFAANLWLAYLIVRTQVRRLWAALAVTFLATSAFLYAFSRLAILEPLLTTFWLASMLLCLRLPERTRPRARMGALVALGLLLCLMILTKTTAIFLLPSVVFLLWNSCGKKMGESVRALAVTVAAGVVPFVVYYLGFVRPHYLEDYKYLFTANEWQNPVGLRGYLAAFWYAIHGMLWIDPRLCVLALVLVAMAAFAGRAFFRNPLLIASVLGVAGFVFFIGWHNNMQPRYYEVLAYPLVFAVVLAIQAIEDAGKARPLVRWLVISASLAGVVIATLNLREVVYWNRHPQYTWVTAARQLTDYIDQHPNGNRLLLSISGDEITLLTHLPAICDDFGTWELPDRVAHYQPGWYAAWNELDPGTLEDIHTQYFLEQVAVFRAFDDEDRDHLVLYKLHPIVPGKPVKDIRTQEDDNGEGGSDDR
jgi:4-amino-4-deoxy-L-arabinose transferase-like glycosyltransferase